MSRKKLRKARLPRRPEALVRAVVAGDSQAWHQLVEDAIGFLYSLAWPFARGERDVADELVLVVLEGLRRPDAEGQAFYRLRRYLDSLERFGDRSRFTTWLAQVARNLIRDHFRSREGRRLVPRKVEDLGPAAQLVFEAMFWEGLSESEALERLRESRPAATRDELDSLLGQVHAALEQRQLWNLYRDLMRRLPALPLDGQRVWAGRGLGGERPLSMQPDAFLRAKAEWDRAQILGATLREAVDDLPKTTGRVLRLALLRELNGAEIQKIMGFSKRQRVYDLLAQARERLRQVLEAKGYSAEDVEELGGWLAGWLDEENSPDRDKGAV